MIFDLSHLKKIRNQLNMTQQQFALKAGISQSMVAKIEAGKLDPTYSYVKKIELALNTLSKKDELKAIDILTKKIISVTKDTTIEEAVKLLINNKISQLPVIENGNLLGLVTESSIISSGPNITTKKVKDIMIESPPIVSKSISRVIYVSQRSK
ncbi:helix-turn-helix domain-containing protein [Candidatus Woesearchaeota archaeon]|nr:helix-turn-helix domain-containing protein [Candidatus Woesearchaeota archaeon]